MKSYSELFLKILNTQNLLEELMGKRWTDEEKKTLAYLLSFPNKYTYLDLSEVMDRPVSSIRRICSELDLQDNVKKIKSNGEEILFDFLREIYPDLVITKQYPVGERLHLDIYIPDLAIGFEYDGIQHSQENSFFHKNKDSFLRGQVLDDKKDNICESKGIHLIRIGYEDTLSKDFIINEINKVGPGELIDDPEDKESIRKNYNKEQYKLLKEQKKNSDYHKFLKKRNKDFRKERYSWLKSIKKEHGN